MRKLLEEIFAVYHKDVYNYLYSLCHDTSLSEDLASEVFLQVVKSIAGFRGESDVKTWLFSIARHEWFNYLKKKNRQPEAEVLSEFLESNDEKADDIFFAEELKKRLYELLDKENERTKNIVLMRMDGYSFYEIGKAHGISENSARVIDFRAKAKIRQILKKEGFIDD
ncbi:MAG: sigma-70 family RNA polymerase sigma factor [Lachnospiraceae bacterium]|nr:sigma-70 family RNA polymerase sigma factor [Lachnospiraceae bacterium]